MKSISRSSGIYIIFCSRNSKIYVGSSKNVATRWTQHKKMLKRKMHANPYLQKAWDKHGMEAFFIIMIESVDEKLLMEREQYWLDELQPFENNGYNIAKIAGNSALGVTRSEETRQKIREARKKQILPPITPETRAVQSMRMMGKKNALGNKHTPEEIEKIAASRRGKKRAEFSEEWRRKLSEANKGRVLSDAQKEAISRANTGRLRTPEQKERMGIARSKKSYIVTSPMGEEFVVTTLGQFCLQNNLNDSVMRSVAKGVYKQHRGWKCRLA